MAGSSRAAATISCGLGYVAVITPVAVVSAVAVLAMMPFLRPSSVLGHPLVVSIKLSPAVAGSPELYLVERSYHRTLS